MISPSASRSEVCSASSRRRPNRTAVSHWPVRPVSASPLGENNDTRSTRARGGSSAPAGRRNSPSQRPNGVILNDLVATIERALPGEVAPNRPPRLSGKPQLTLGVLVDVSQGLDEGTRMEEILNCLVAWRQPAATLNETVKTVHPVDDCPCVSERDRRRWNAIPKIGREPTIDDVHGVDRKPDRLQRRCLGSVDAFNRPGVRQRA